MTPIMRQIVTGKKVIVRDGFDRPNSNTSMGVATSGQPWQALAGTWGISNNQAYLVDSAMGRCVIETGRSNFTTSVTMANYIAGSGLLFRGVDADNFLVAICGATTFSIYKNVAGVLTKLGEKATQPKNGDKLKVKINGNNISLWVNNNLFIVITNTSFATATQVGLYSPGGSALARWDDLKVEAI